MIGKFSRESLEAYKELISELHEVDFSEGEAYDFTRCVRSDGSAYGTGGTCRKGRRGAKKERPTTERKRRAPRLNKEEKIAMQVMGDRSLRSDKARMSEMIRKGVPQNTDFLKLVMDTREKLGISPMEKFPSSRKTSPSTKLVSAQEKKKKGAKSGGMRLTERIKTLPAEDLKKVLGDPRLSNQQKDLLQKLLLEKQRENSEPAVKPKVVAKSETAQKNSTGKRKLTDEKLKQSFDKTLSLLEKAKGDVAEARALESLSVIRQAYHAVNREEFLKASAEISRNRRKASDLRDQAEREARRQGLNLWGLPESHPLKKLTREAYNLEYVENVKLKDRKNAAYFGEPLEVSPLKTKGGGEVDPSVPSSLPRGGGDKKLREFLEGSEVVMAFPREGFKRFVEEGKTKNGFESGTEGIKKGKRFYLDNRRAGEDNVLDVPRDAKPQERPVYAALEHPDRSKSLQGASGGLMAQYGGIQVVFKDTAKDRSTFTIGDSIDYNEPRGVKASPVRDPANPKSFGKKVEITYGDTPHTKGITIKTPKDSGEDTPPYVEAQIYGGLRTSDIKEVRYYKGHEIDPATRSLLEKQGVKIVELPPQMDMLRVSKDHPGFSDITTIVSEK